MASAEGLSPVEKSENDESHEPFTYKSGASFNVSASTMDGMLSRRKEIPDDLACFLQQQKQRQARQETTMRSFPTSGDMDQDKMALDQKKKRHQHEDPLSHRIIEKRRRDRMNNCLADLSRLIPSSYLKKGRGRIEKTEIIEMAIKHIRHLQSHPCTKVEGCELESEIKTGLNKASTVESFRVGYHECLTETMHFLVEKEGLYAGNSFCVRLMTHLQKHFDKLGRASTSEIHSVVGRTWAGTNLPGEKRDREMDRERERRQDVMGVKSEFGVASEESGYRSETQSMREREAAESVQVWPRSETEAGDLEPSDLPSDLSLGHHSGGQAEDRDEARLAEDLSMASNLYKFKSSIRQRFHSSRSCDEEKDILVPEKRSRLDSASTDRDNDHSFDVDLDAVTRRDSYSPGPITHDADHTDGASDLKPQVPSGHSGHGHHIPVFALSPRGSFYVPLSVNASNLEDFLPLLSESSSGPLHPVTISVKFCPSFTSAPASTMSDQGQEPGPSSDWRNSARSGVIQPPQSVIKNWRQDTS